MTQIVTVLGGTGKTGRRVVSKLRAGGHTVRPASRSTEIPFDWLDDSTWQGALTGADAVYLVPPALPSQQVTLVPGFVRRAVDLGVRRLVLLSARGIDRAENPDALTCERAVRDSGVAWTVVRPAWFAQNFSEEFFQPQVMQGVIAAPAGDGKVPFVDAEDIAEVAAAALTDERHAGQIYELSGPEALSFGQAAALIGEALNRPVQFVDIPPEEFVRGATSAGLPEEHAGLLAGLFGVIRNGWDERLSEGVQQALGRQPADFKSYVNRSAAEGKWGEPQ
ncbi:SDR family oxidoreductase [Streptomyces piniterrae]|uniref:SDR family oxidoreductase n=1 Tax=Streptomyces piniterrae TaxID=2571125 RepID=A0A4V5MMQ7_9ACTN|nr:SDR family oxidoreductase [Streptomyces piniterrae]TJZ54258.1 SDR family oxidoreductase [Streptomyces piniterrae]